MYNYRAVSFLLFAATLSTAAFALPVVFSVGGDTTPASIQSTVNSFRGALGSPNNGNAAGPLVGGRREINWDGGGSTATSPVGTPFTGFQNTRGAQFFTPGTGFVQAPDEDGADGGLETFFNNATYGTTFNPFSPVRLFTPVDSNLTDALFFIPGTAGGTPASVSGFGAVFTDVDLANSSALEFFDIHNVLLGSFNIPAGSVADGSRSFLGVIFPGEQIGRVHIVSGNTALTKPNGATDDPANGVDIVVMDDFLFSEPVAQAPEPSALALFGAGVLALAVVRRKRRAGRL